MLLKSVYRLRLCVRKESFSCLGKKERVFSRTLFPQIITIKLTISFNIYHVARLAY